MSLQWYNMLSIDESDIPKSKMELYRDVFPTVKDLIHKIFVD